MNHEDVAGDDGKNDCALVNGMEMMIAVNRIMPLEKTYASPNPLNLRM